MIEISLSKIISTVPSSCHISSNGIMLLFTIAPPGVSEEDYDMIKAWQSQILDSVSTFKVIAPRVSWGYYFKKDVQFI